MKTSTHLSILAILLACAAGLHAASTIQFTVTTYFVTEDAGAVTLTVQRSDDTNTVVSVDYASTNLTATAGEDQTEIKGTLEFAAGDTVKTLTIPITYDETAEPDEKLNLTLSNPSGGIVLDPQGPATGPGRVIRGGYFIVWSGEAGYAGDCRSAFRTFNSSPGDADGLIGFRVLLAPGQ